MIVVIMRERKKEGGLKRQRKTERRHKEYVY